MAAAAEGGDALLRQSLDAAWLVLTAAGILLTQVGFASLESAAARRKDERTVLFKNLLDHSVASVCWYIAGWRILTMNGWFDTKDPDMNHGRILQQFGFEITTSSIVSASVLGRCRMDTYIAFSGFLAGFSYPLLAYAVWNPLGPLNAIGFRDWGGGGVVHLFGATSGMIASKLCGKRVGPEPSGTHVPALTAIGGLVLYISWFFVNAGSSGGLSSEMAIRGAQKAALNTALTAGGASVMAFLICRMHTKRLDLDFLVNSLVGGLISITAPGGFINPPAAILLGFATPWVIMQSSRFIKTVFDLQDPLEAGSVHGACALLGLLGLGLFHATDGLLYAFRLNQLISQITGVFFILVWVMCTSLPFFTIAKWMNALSYTDNELQLGLDNLYFGGDHHQKEDNDKKAMTPPSVPVSAGGML